MKLAATNRTQDHTFCCTVFYLLHFMQGDKMHAKKCSFDKAYMNANHTCIIGLPGIATLCMYLA